MLLLVSTLERSGLAGAVWSSNDYDPLVLRHSIEEKISALAEIICCAGDEPAAALFVLMGTLEHSTQPKILANTAKHFAFTCCGESNLYGLVDAQIAVVEDELLACNTLTS